MSQPRPRRNDDGIRAILLAITAATLAVIVLAPSARALEQERRPNILFLLADDLGWADVGFNNPGTFYDTPNVDRLAAEGMRFTQAYAACPVCSPTRASLMTGNYPARMATTDWFGAPQPEAILAAGRAGQTGRFQKLPLLPAPYVDHLPHESTTLAEALRDSGYATFFAGKWHLGGKGSSPLEHGFQLNVAGHHRGGPYGKGRYFHPFEMPGLASKPGDHLPARLAEETITFIDAQRETPWFAMLSFYSVHTPLMGRDDLVARYEDKRRKLDLAPAWGQEGERRNRLVQEHAVYAAMVAAMDEAVGAVLAALDRRDLARDTVVVFFSDNGGLSTSEGHPTSNLPLRAGKGWLYEGGIREPCVVRWPGRIAAATSSAQPIISCDLPRTLLAAAGAAVPDGHFVDGVDLLPILRGQPDAMREGPLFWHYPHWGNQGGDPGSAIRDGDWKLIEWSTPGRAPELYHLTRDPGESTNLAAIEPERAAALLASLHDWRAAVGARPPRPNPLLDAPAK